MLKRLHNNESGFLLVVTMIILVVLTIVGMTALDNSMFEIQIASNDRNAKVAFNLADGAVYSTGKLVTEAIEGSGDPSHNTIEYESFTMQEDGSTSVSHTADDFYKRVMGYVDTQTKDPLIDPALPDLQIKPYGAGEDETVEIYLISRNSKLVAGGGAEFGAGSAGAGVGSGGAGAAVTFDINVDAFASNNSKAKLYARYRKILGASGGL